MAKPIDTPKLLIIDDDIGICTTLSDIFKELGYYVEAVHKGTEALEVTRQRYFNIALVDIKLPDKQGIMLIRQLKERYNMACIVITGYASIQTAIEAFEVGSVRYLIKPLVMEDVIRCVKEVLDKQNLENKLKISEQRYRGLIEASIDAIVSIDEAGNIVQVNNAALKLTGYSKKELKNKTIDFLIPDVYKKECAAFLSDLRLDSEFKIPAAPIEISIFNKEGKCIPVELSLSILRNGSEFLLTGIIRDITLRKNAEQSLKRSKDELEDEVKKRTNELTRSNFELEQYAYIISHDIQSPLQNIISFSKLLSSELSEDLNAKAKEYINYILKSADTMQALIKDLLKYARVHYDTDKLDSIDCNKVIKTVISNLQMEISQSSAEVTCDTLPVIIGNESNFIQLFQNLISNSIKFRSDKPPIIRLSAKKKNGKWLFSIEDNGIGIPKDDLERIFLIYQRLHDKSKYPGTGIGLAVCKKIVETHGGNIWAESELGKGTKFLFTL
ncbi:multi-sensor signal transduction histidine kinase [Candidatus Magnetoovum chiemensis]|nr:multi-sensor signal transduction histidine kinase [Candidatus Magnetoovum chiemensis]